jgi:hypothetical protein
MLHHNCESDYASETPRFLETSVLYETHGFLLFATPTGPGEAIFSCKAIDRPINSFLPQVLEPFAIQPSIRILDAFANPVSSSCQSVTLHPTP